MQRSRKKWRIVSGLLLCALAGLVALFLVGDYLSWRSAPVSLIPPSDLDIAEVSFGDAGDNEVRGWAIGTVGHRGSVLLVHGIKSDRRSLINRARFLVENNYSVLMIDMYAHGESAGDKYTYGYREAGSVAAALNFMRSRWSDQKIALIGLSLGGVAAVLAARQARADAYVLEAAYTDIDKAIQNRLELRLGSLAGYFTPLLSWQIPWRLDVPVEEFSVVDHIADLEKPVFLIAGARDQRTTLADTEEIFINAGEPKSLWVLPDARHWDFHGVSKDEYEAKVLNFLEKYLK